MISTVFTLISIISGRCTSGQSVLKRRIDVLADFPFMAPQTSIKGIFELPFVRYPYKVYYEVDGDEVQILRIRDSRRQPWIPTRG
jgi:plasmid stabilization system protein ParE